MNADGPSNVVCLAEDRLKVLVGEILTLGADAGAMKNGHHDVRLVVFIDFDARRHVQRLDELFELGALNFAVTIAVAPAARPRSTVDVNRRPTYILKTSFSFSSNEPK